MLREDGWKTLFSAQRFLWVLTLKRKFSAALFWLVLKCDLACKRHVPSNIRFQRCDDYEIHYTSLPDSHAPVEGPIVVYFPIQKEAFASTFLPTPGLADRNSPEFDPTARLVRKKGSNDRFVITATGIRTNNPHIAGLTDIVQRLMATGGFKEVFQPSELPVSRWDNVRLASIPLSSGLEEYCDALRARYSNGFVEARRYRIEEGSVEDLVLNWKLYPWYPEQFMEMLRHPTIAGDFEFEGADWERLVSRENWTHYSPFLLSGYLAQTLVCGGAYSSSTLVEDGISRALELSNGVFTGLGSNYKGPSLYVCRKPWCRRLMNVAWDHTWIVFEPLIRTFTILLATDTD